MKNEAEKPVVPQFIDTWIQGAKYNGFDLREAMTDDSRSEKVAAWICWNSEVFAKAWLYGYEVEVEVEKEKLYTARLKLISDERYCYIVKRKEDKILFISNLEGNRDLYHQIHFTQAELEELEVWDNPIFEIEEEEEG